MESQIGHTYEPTSDGESSSDDSQHDELQNQSQKQRRIINGRIEKNKRKRNIESLSKIFDSLREKNEVLKSENLHLSDQREVLKVKVYSLEQKLYQMYALLKERAHYLVDE